MKQWISDQVAEFGFLPGIFLCEELAPSQLPSLSFLLFLDGDKIKLSLWLSVALVIGLIGLGET